MWPIQIIFFLLDSLIKGCITCTQCIDAAYWYWCRTYIAWSVCLCVCLCVRHASDLCKNGWIDRDAIWGRADSSGPKEPWIRCGPHPPREGAILRFPGPLKSTENLCCGAYSKRDHLIVDNITQQQGSIQSSITAWQRDCSSQLQCSPAGRCHITVFPWKIRPVRCGLLLEFFDHLFVLSWLAAWRRGVMASAVWRCQRHSARCCSSTKSRTRRTGDRSCSFSVNSTHNWICLSIRDSSVSHSSSKLVRAVSVDFKSMRSTTTLRRRMNYEVIL